MPIARPKAALSAGCLFAAARIGSPRRMEPTPGGVSDRFKRVSVKWGLGRYLYGLPSAWMPCEKKGPSVVLQQTSRLPLSAVPIGDAERQCFLA